MSNFTKNIVLCNGTEPNYDVYDEKFLRLESREERQGRNVRIGLNNFENAVYLIKDRSKDLLEIAAFVFAADRNTSRGKDDNLFYERWDREFDFHIPVRDLDFWDNDEIKDLLNDALKYMSGDRVYKFNFYKNNDNGRDSLFDSETFTIRPYKGTRILLFSGGLDSLAGTIKTLEETEKEVCLISHQSGQPSVIKTQRELFNEIEKLYPDRCSHYKYKAGLAGTSRANETQRTRSFLYCSTAFVIAKVYNENEIFIYENGVTSINLPETQDMGNARASRTTHPKALGLLEKLFKKISEADFKIVNEFLYETKTDVINLIKDYNKEELIEKAVTCSRTRNNSANSTHCGECSQCIDRIYAVYATGTNKFDDYKKYKKYFPKENIIQGDLRKVLIDQLRLTIKFNKISNDDIYFEHPSEFIDIEEYIEGADEEEKAERITSLLNKHADNVKKAIDLMRKENDNVFVLTHPQSFYGILNNRTYLMDNDNPYLDIKKENDSTVSNELANAQGIILRQKAKIKTLENGITPDELRDIVEEKCRRKNGTINYSELGRILGCNNKTAKSRCIGYNIS